MSIAKWLLAKKLGGGSPFPPVIKRVTGNPIEFTDGADAPLVKCVTQITGSQDLHGYDKPWVGGAGKNKFGGEYNQFFPLHFSSEVTITASANPVSGVNPQIAYFDENQTQIDYWGMSQQYSSVSNRVARTFTYPTTAYYVKFITNETTDYQIEVSSTNTAFAPYSNICPITAYTEGEIEVRGKNLFNKDALGVRVGYAINPIDGTTYITSSGTWNTSDYIGINGINSITIYDPISAESYDVVFFDSDKTYISGGSFDGNNRVISVPSNASFVRFDYRNTNDSSIMLIITGGDTTVYEPYTSATHTTTYPSAIYRGSEDVVNGEVESEWIKQSMSDYVGQISMVLTQSSGVYRARFVPSPQVKISGLSDIVVISNCLVGVDPWKTYGAGARVEMSISGDTSGNYIDMFSSDLQTVSAWENFITENNMEIAYLLSTPTTSSVTPTNLPIKSLSGYNHIESSTGDMEIDYITEGYQNFVDTVESALPNTNTRNLLTASKGGTKAMDIFLSLEKRDDKEEEVKEETKDDMR